MKYLLDTNAVSMILRGDRTVRRRLTYHPALDVAVSSIVLSELWFGCLSAANVNKHLTALRSLQFQIVSFDAADAQRTGEIRADLWQLGTPIGPYDTLIAGQAVARNLTLVTHNTREFARVPGLRLEDWEA